MKKLLTALLAVCFLATTAWATPEFKQPIYTESETEHHDTISYIDRNYFWYDSKIGVAGYKTIDEMVKLEKISFKDFHGNKIFMVRILPDKKVVGYGIKVWESKFSLEDSNCDGIMDKVGLYSDLVFPPDCFHPDGEFEAVMDDLAKDLADFAKLIQEINDALKI